ncbi:uncharacterized protein T551_00149 [Pneumocystis jirovecii RU7]|uniref:Nucleoporin NSP1 n=2 Tax=Pneumocystis jirovecii TaxID=42068 RepID=A0A0W4ZWB2_PNEJ7|nr:uncharacterized protein T551_00149 [Pneumocystis jirovecii RU7]KTW32664.1 hypothetical protein T551_00149 [Pneumocystis jirovecii RU7]
MTCKLSEFRFPSASNTNSSQTTGNTNEFSGHTTTPATSTGGSVGTGLGLSAAPSTPSTSTPFGMASFTFGNSTTPAGQPPAHPLGQGGILIISRINSKLFNIKATGTTEKLFGVTSKSTLSNTVGGMTSAPTGSLETSGSGTSLFNLGGTGQKNTSQPSSTTPFSFGETTPQLDTKSVSQNKPTTAFSFTGFSGKNEQTLQEKTTSTQPFSFGGSTATTSGFVFGTNAKTDTPPVSIEKPSIPSESSKTIPTFSFGSTLTQQNQQKTETSTQKPEESKPTFTFNLASAPNTTTKNTAPSTTTLDTTASNTTVSGTTVSENTKPSLSGDISTPIVSSTLFKSSESTSSNTPNLSTKDSSQISKSTLDPIKPLSNTSTQEPQVSNLKNKTIEDIINKWTSDLEKYSRQFSQQAAEVSKWDRLLIESGDKISKLYADTIEAEQTQLKVDQTLTYIESQQNEMSAFLDQYENQVQELSDRQFGGPDGMQPADQEREKVYNLAEKLTEQLDGLGKNLKSMIEEINTASNLINKTNEDDPLSSIIKILNSHLSSLQWIQSTTTKLHYKIEEVKKAEHAIEKQIEESSFYSGRNIGFS